MLVAQEPVRGEQSGVFGEVLAVHDQVLPVHVDLDVLDPLGAQGVDDMQRHADVPHEDLHRRLGVLVLEEHGDATPVRVLGGLADAVDEALPGVRVAGLEGVVVALDPGPDDEVGADVGGQVDPFRREPERLGPRRVVRRRETAFGKEWVKVQAARDAVHAVAVERLLHLFEVLAGHFLRIVELVVVDQVAEPLHGGSHLAHGRCAGQFGLVARPG